MSHVMLFRPTYDAASRSAPAFPWSLVYLASVLAERGIEVTIVDEVCTKDCEKRVLDLLETKPPIAVGITSMTGEQLRHGLAFARLVREHGAAVIIWGGIHASLLPEQTVRHPLVDFVVAGEGEYALADLIDCIEERDDPSDIPGVFMKRSGGVAGSKQEMFIDLASLPELPFHLVDIERYIVARPDLGMERCFEICTSRGCPHHCGFCYIESVHGSCWRPIEAGATVERIKALVERFQLDGLLFREDNFFVQRDRVEKIARLLVQEKVNIAWAASCRINYFASYRPEFVDLLRESGCVQLTFGVESGSNRVLDYIGKGITVEMVLRVARKVKEAGIRGTYHFMGGFPGETAHEFLDTCRLIDALIEIAPDAVVREMSIFAPYPGIRLIPECVKRGYEEPSSLEGWIEMDWSHPERPWLEPAHARLISDAQYLIARLAHPNRVLRSWARRRWAQMLRNPEGIVLKERPAIEFLRRHR